MTKKAQIWRAKGGIQDVEKDDTFKGTLNIPAMSIPIEIKIVDVSKKKTQEKCKTDDEVERVRVHIFSTTKKVWKLDEPSDLKFKVAHPSTEATVQQIVKSVVNRKHCGSYEDWAITEVRETGDGTWSKGTTIPYTSSKAKEAIKAFPWTAERNEDEGPVWLNIHRHKSVRWPCCDA